MEISPELLAFNLWSGQRRDEQIRLETLSEAARDLQRQARQRFDQHGPQDPRGAALWDAACHLVEQLGDGDWRRP